MISFSSKGNFSKTLSYLNKLDKLSGINFDKYGQEGVRALSSSAPKDSGLMARSWGYKVERNNNNVTITWTNSDIEGGCNVAVLIQYGHATRGGTMVKGVDFINPAMKPVFENIAQNVWKEVTRL